MHWVDPDEEDWGDPDDEEVDWGDPDEEEEDWGEVSTPTNPFCSSFDY